MGVEDLHIPLTAHITEEDLNLLEALVNDARATGSTQALASFCLEKLPGLLTEVKEQTVVISTLNRMLMAHTAYAAVAQDYLVFIASRTGKLSADQIEKYAGLALRKLVDAGTVIKERGKDALNRLNRNAVPTEEPGQGNP